jgi:hypothetical protein
MKNKLYRLRCVVKSCLLLAFKIWNRRFALLRLFSSVQSNAKKRCLYCGCALVCVLFVSCKKDFNSFKLASSRYFNDEMLKTPIKIIKPTRFPLQICIFSYDQLVTELTSNPISVNAVVLDDGTRITTGSSINGMTYRAIESNESNSLFRSDFTVGYNLYGYQQENETNCWSLGCIYLQAGTPPFTNIVKNNKTLLINTHFVWSVPGGIGKTIKYLEVK